MAVSIEKDIETLLLATTAVANVVGARIYWMNAPDGSLTEPYIVYSTTSVNGELIYIGTRTADALIQLSIFDSVAARGLLLANAVFDTLSAYHGKPGDKVIQYVSCNGPSGFRDPDYDNVYQFVVSAEVRYER